MVKLYKLVNQSWTTHHSSMKWEIGKRNVIEIPGKRLCSPEVIHAYTHPLLAVFLNPIHANIEDPILLEVESFSIVADDNGLKVGVKDMLPIRVMGLPVVTIEQRVSFGILCALRVCNDKDFVLWASKWLSGEDRSKLSAYWAEVKATTMATAWAAAAAGAEVAAAVAVARAAAAAAAAAGVVNSSFLVECAKTAVPSWKES